VEGRGKEGRTGEWEERGGKWKERGGKGRDGRGEEGNRKLRPPPFSNSWIRP